MNLTKHCYLSESRFFLPFVLRTYTRHSSVFFVLLVVVCTSSHSVRKKRAYWQKYSTRWFFRVGMAVCEITYMYPRYHKISCGYSGIRKWQRCTTKTDIALWRRGWKIRYMFHRSRISYFFLVRFVNCVFITTMAMGY